MKIIWAGKAYWINFFILYYIFLIIFIGSIVFLKFKKGKVQNNLWSMQVCTTFVYMFKNFDWDFFWEENDQI